MISSNQYFLINNIRFFTFLIFSYLMTIICIIKTDFDFHRKKRLNNGNYLVLTTTGIYIYNENFNSRIELVVFGERLIDDNKDIYMSDIEQF